MTNSQKNGKILKILADMEKIDTQIYVICSHFKENMSKVTWIGWRWEDHPHGSRSTGSRYSCSDLTTKHVLKSTKLLTGGQQTTLFSAEIFMHVSFHTS